MFDFVFFLIFFILLIGMSRPDKRVIRFGLGSLPFCSGIFLVCAGFGSIRYGSGMLGSVPIQVCVILFYYEYRYHFSHINVGSIWVRVSSFRVRVWVGRFGSGRFSQV